MKKTTKKIFGVLLAAATAMSAVNVSLAEETAQTWEGKASLLEQWNKNNGGAAQGYCWVGEGREWVLQYRTGDRSGARVKSAKLQIELKDNSGSWKYDKEANYQALINCLYKNEWETAKSAAAYAALTENVADEDAIQAEFTYGDTSATAAVDVTGMVKKGLDDGKVSFIIKNGGEDGKPVFTFNNDQNPIKFSVTYMTDAEFLGVINNATEEDIDSVIAATDSKYADAYGRLVNKQSIREAVCAEEYESIDAFVSAFETAFEAYMENPATEDKAGKTAAIEHSLYGSGDISNNDTLTISNGYITFIYPSQRALIKFDIGDINRDYVKRATLTYKLREKGLGNWYTYDSTKDASVSVDGISSNWEVGSERIGTIKDNPAFIENENFTTTYKKAEMNTYAVMAADITEDFKTRTVTDGNISYMLRSLTATAGHVIVDAEGAYTIEIEYINDYELLNRINSAATAEGIEEILNSGLFADNETYKKYTELKNKSRINAALIQIGEGYADMAAFEDAFETAYKAYIADPAVEDEAGKTATVSHILYGYGDTKNNDTSTIMNNYTTFTYDSTRALIKFDIDDINRDYVKRATLTYKLREKGLGSWYTYDSTKDASVSVDGISSNWEIGSSRDDTIKNSAFTENENFTTTYKKAEMNTYAVMAVDITEDFKTRTVTDGNISYMLRSLTNRNYHVVVDDESAYAIEIEYLNGYELLQKYNAVKDNAAELTKYIGVIAAIENDSDITPLISATLIKGKDFTSYDEMLSAIKNASANGKMAVFNETVDLTEAGKIKGSFNLYNFTKVDEDEETDIVCAIVAGYDSESNEMIASYIVGDGEIEINRAKESEGDLVFGTANNLTFTLNDADSKIDTVRVYLWDGFDMMRNYSEAKTIYTK